MATYHPNPDVVLTQIDEQDSVLLSLDTQQYYSLNETGSRIWELISVSLDPEAIALEVAKEWDTSPKEALRYVHSFLQELVEEGLTSKEWRLST
jgi:hypothetical protein